MAPFFHNPFCSPSNHTISITILADQDKLPILEQEAMLEKLFHSVVTCKPFLFPSSVFLAGFSFPCTVRSILTVFNSRQGGGRRID
jgi:hypothetical protein